MIYKGMDVLKSVSANNCETMQVLPVSSYTTTAKYICPASMKLITEDIYMACC